MIKNIFNIRYLSIMLILFSSPVFAQQKSTIIDSSGFAYANLTYNVPGTIVIIDKNKSIENPWIIELPPGEHEICGFHPDKSLWLKPAWYKKVKLICGDTVDVNIQLLRILWLDTEPTGASVFIKNTLVGITPLSVSIPQNSQSVISLSKTGYRNKLVTAPDLTKDITCIKLSTLFTSKLQQRAISKKYIYGAALLYFASQISGYLLKKAADREFFKYNSVANTAQMNKYFYRTQKLDKLSTVCYSASEITLGISVYFVIRNINGK